MLCTFQAPGVPVGVDIGVEVRETLVVIWGLRKRATGAGITEHHLRDVLIVWAPTGALPLFISVTATSIATAGAVDAATGSSGWTRPPACLFSLVDIRAQLCQTSACCNVNYFCVRSDMLTTRDCVLSLLRSQSGGFFQSCAPSPRVCHQTRRQDDCVVPLD